MYEHPYLASAVTAHEQEQLAADAERRRQLRERADQIVPRAAGPVRRFGRRMLRAVTGPRDVVSISPRDRGADAGGPADRRVRDGRVPGVREPASAR